MSKYGNSYSGNDFLEWWRTHYGTEYDGSNKITKIGTMTDEDVAIGQSLLNVYNKQQQINSQYQIDVDNTNANYDSLLENSNTTFDGQISQATSDFNKNSANLLANYNNSLSHLDTSKKSSQQMASIAYDKLKKYLPTQIKAQGLGGLGVSESTMLQAQNSYVNNMGEIEANYNENKTNLDTSYNTNKIAYDTEYEKRISGLKSDKTTSANSIEVQRNDSLDSLKRDYNLSMYNSDKDENGNSLVQNVLDEYKASKEKDEYYAYDNAMVSIDNSGIYDQEQMTSFVEQFKGKVSDSQFNALLARGQSVATANKQYRDDIAEEEAKQQQKEETAKEEAKRQEAQDEIVSFLTVNYEEIEDWAGGLAYLEANEGAFVNKELYNNLHSAYSSKLTAQQEAEAKAEAEAKQAETDKRILTGDKNIEYNGKEYKLAEKLGRQANEIRKNADFTKQLNALGYTDPYDENIPNGTTFYIRRDWSGSNNVSFWDFIPIANVASITGAGNGWHVTYYNGEWYHSSEQ